MPYIKPQDREKFIKAINEDDIGALDLLCEVSDKCQTVGEINYSISVIIHEYLKRKGLNYSNVNELIGVLECAKLELYRVIAAPYEDIKIEENGYVSDLDSRHHVTLFKN